MLPRRWVLLADDMTGLADTALAFYEASSQAGNLSKASSHVQVYPHASSAFSCEGNALSLTPSASFSASALMLEGYQADVRLATPEAIATRFALTHEHVCPTWHHANAWQCGDLGFYLKIDSTLRGAWPVLVQRVWSRLRHGLLKRQGETRSCHVVLSPMVPSQGRWTQADGTHGVMSKEGVFVPVHETPMGSDPLTPVVSSRLQDYLTAPLGEPSGEIEDFFCLPHVWVHEVRAKHDETHTETNDVKSRPCVWLIHATEEDDFYAQVQWLTVHLKEASILWVGAAGLMQAVCRSVMAQEETPKGMLPRGLSVQPTLHVPSQNLKSFGAALPVLVLIQGSVTPLTFEQYQAFVTYLSFQTDLGMPAIWHTATWETWLATPEDASVTLTPGHVYIASAYETKEEALQCLPKSPWASPVADFQTMAGRVYQYFHALRSRAETPLDIWWCLAGGETTAGVLKQALPNDRPLVFQGQVEPNIPMLRAFPSHQQQHHHQSFAQAPSLQDIWVTKSGFFGSRHLWQHVFERAMT